MKNEIEENKANIIQRLQKQHEKLQRPKEELEKQQQILKEMKERLEHNTDVKMAEKLKPEDKILAKQVYGYAKDEEARRLFEQADEAPCKQEEKRRQRKLEEVAKQCKELPVGATLPNLADVNDQLREQLKFLQQKLDKTRNQTVDTDLDKIHRVNLAQGRTKYNPQSDIRRGNTQQKMEMFENM